MNTRPWSLADGAASAAARDPATLDDDFAKGLCPDCYGKVNLSLNRLADASPE